MGCNRCNKPHQRGRRPETWSSSMAEETLVESRVRDSTDLIAALDAQGDPPTAALWYYYPDAETWCILIASPTFDPLLPKEDMQAYRKIVAALQKCSLRSLTIVDAI